MSDEEMRAQMAIQMQQMMQPDPEIEAMMGAQRQPQGDPSFAQSAGAMGAQYHQMPEGQMAQGMNPASNMPVVDPYAPRPMASPLMRGFR